MNKLPATIVNIETSGNISLIDLESKGERFTSVIIETPETADYLKIGKQVYIIFKETEVSIGKNVSGQISLRNRLKSNIIAIEKGGVLSKIVLDYKDTTINAIITTRSANQLNLQIGEAVTGFVKTTEVSIMDSISLKKT